MRYIPENSTLTEAIKLVEQCVKAARTKKPIYFDQDALGDDARDLFILSFPNWLASKQGWLYVSENEAWPGSLKLGCTRKSLESRMKSLASAGVPTPWALRAHQAVYDAHWLEARLHKRCELHLRGREMYNISLTQARAAISSILQEDVELLLAGLGSFFLPGQLHEMLLMSCLRDCIQEDGQPSI